MTHKERIDRINQECTGVWSQYGVTAWERSFLKDVRNCESISAKQAAVLDHIEEKVFGEENDA